MGIAVMLEGDFKYESEYTVECCMLRYALLSAEHVPHARSTVIEIDSVTPVTVTAGCPSCPVSECTLSEVKVPV